MVDRNAMEEQWELNNLIEILLKTKTSGSLKFPIEIFWIIGAWDFEIRSSLISKQFGLWKPEPPPPKKKAFCLKNPN